MTRPGVLVCVATCGVVAGCAGGPSAPSGVPVFAEGRVSMTFTPQNQTFAEAAEAYRSVWVAEGSAIVDAMQRGTGLTFLESHVDVRIGPADLDEHRVLDLFLYDVWESLWGRALADEQVKFESGLRGLYDYETAWQWALSLGKAERASRIADIVKANRR